MKERRKSARKEVLETFHVFLVIPKIGLRKVYLKDVSLGGIGFFAEKEDRFKEGEELEIFFHINPNLRLPLAVKIMHLYKEPEGVRVGCQFTDKSSKAHKAFIAFMELLDELSAFVST